ncbi:MAG: hypothetical protein AAFV80_15710, partial [Bacteroidota bacterium]
IERSKNLIVDLHEADSAVFLSIGMASQLKNNMLLLYQNVDELPLSFKPYEKVHYSTSKKGLARLEAELDYHLQPEKPSNET